MMLLIKHVYFKSRCIPLLNEGLPQVPRAYATQLTAASASFLQILARHPSIVSQSIRPTQCFPNDTQCDINYRQLIRDCNIITIALPYII